MRYYNPLYTRKWTKIFVPMSTFFTQLGTQLGFQTNTNNDESINSLSNEYNTNSSNINNSSSLSTLFSTLTSPFRPRYKTFISYKKHPNGIIKQDNNHTIYHQLDIHRINDENNNEKINDINQNSIIINIPTNYSNDILINTDNKYTNFFILKEYIHWIILASFIYFLWFIFIAGISIVHILIYLILIIFLIISERTRRFALAV
ncbi:unnamed protein product [Rotaria sp. Silwood1]|nr:unnamed protein product [Rotaria sp. Silwood1]